MCDALPVPSTPTTLSTFLSSAVPHLLTLEQAQVLSDEGMREPGKFANITAADLRATVPGLRLADAADLIAAAQAARTSRDGAGVDAVALRALLADATSEDHATATAAINALAARGIRDAPMDPQGGVAEQVATRFFALSPDAAASARAAGLFEGRAIRKFCDLLPRAYEPRSPTGQREPLQAGADWRTGVRWGDLPRVDLGLAAWAVEQGLTGGAADDVLHADFAARGARYANVDRVRRARGVTDAQLEALADASTSASHQRDDDRGPATPSAATAKDLYSLLLGMFGADELRRFVRSQSGGPALAAELPGGNASTAQLMWDAADLLHKHGVTRLPEFWASLERERPSRVADIRRVRAGSR